MAALARLLPRNLDHRLGTLGGFLEGDLEIIPKIGATLRTAAPASAAEDVAEPEDVAETAEDILEAGEHARIESARARRRRHAGVAEPVVHRSLFGIREHGVRFGRFLEAI